MRKFQLIFFLNLTCIINAQQRPGKGVWTAINLPVNFTKHWQWHNDAGYRTFSVSIQPIQYLYRTGLRYNFNKQTSTAAGVAWFFTKTDFDKTHHDFGREFRFWQEITHQQPIKKDLQILMRFRMDQRFFAVTRVKDAYNAYRFRLRAGLNQKLNKKWSLQLTDEYMRQISNGKFLLDQNRVTVSGIYQFNRTTQLQGGYLWLKWPNAHQHILTFTFTKNISMHGGK